MNISRKLHKGFIRKTVFVLTAFVMLLCLTGCKSKVAKAVKLDDFYTVPEYAIQDARMWGQGDVSLTDSPTNQDGYRVYKYKFNNDSLEEYMAMLQNNGFTLVGEHHQSSFLGSYQSYGLVYNDATDIDTFKLMYEDVQCHVSIWKDESKWRVDVADGIELCDLGLRRDGTQGKTGPQGESLDVALVKKGKSKFLTADKRFQVKLGEASVIIDGQQQTVPAVWEKHGHDYEITAEVSEEMKITVVYDSDEVKTADIIWQPGGVQEVPVLVRIENNDEKITAEQKGAMQFNNATVRMMYIGEKDEKVIYMYAEPMDTELFPQSVEMLVAVQTTKEESSGGGGGIFTSDRESFKPDHSKLDCLSCNGTGDCDECGGSLYVGYGDARGRCGSCRGTGDCFTCGGSGKR